MSVTFSPLSPRLGLNCAGVMDILTFDASSTPVNPTLQQVRDLTHKLGCVVGRMGLFHTCSSKTS